MRPPNFLHKQPFWSDNHRNRSDEPNANVEIPMPFIGRWYKHASGICLFVTYEISIAKWMGSTAGLQHFLPFYLLDLLFFYAYGHYIIPFTSHYLRKRPYYLIVLVLSIGIQSFLVLVLKQVVWNLHEGDFQLKMDMVRIVHALWRSVFIFGIAWAYWLAVHYILKSRRGKELAIRQKEAEQKSIMLENAYLHARINPHFLFNTLNFLYSATLDKAPEVAGAVEELAGIMHYSLETLDSDGKVDLQLELDNVQRFVNIMRYRYGERLQMEFTMDVQTTEVSYRIPPHILMTFVENIAKHGNLFDKENPVRIAIRVRDGILDMDTRNPKMRKQLLDGERMGLANVRTRLQVYYPSLHELHINDDVDFFMLKLKLYL